MEHSLEKAFEENRAALLRFIESRLHDPARSEDVLHDVYLKLESHSSPQEIRFVKAYIFRIANNLIIDIQRKDGKLVQLQASDVENIEDNENPHKTLDAKEQLALVREAINELPAKTQDVVNLQRLKQMDKREVAEQLDISVNMVEKHLRKALKHCRDKLFKSGV